MAQLWASNNPASLQKSLTISLIMHKMLCMLCSCAGHCMFGTGMLTHADLCSIIPQGSCSHSNVPDKHAIVYRVPTLLSGKLAAQTMTSATFHAGVEAGVGME